MSAPSNASIMSMKLWAKRAQPGEALLYHKGLLMRDRLSRPELDAIAKFMWTIMEKGLVSLVQHRSGESDYEYLAVRR